MMRRSGRGFLRKAALIARRVIRKKSLRENYSQPVLSKLVFCGGSSHPSATTLHGSANPHFVIPSAAEGPAVRLDLKQRPYSELATLNPSGLIVLNTYPACSGEVKMAFVWRQGADTFSGAKIRIVFIDLDPPRTWD